MEHYQIFVIGTGTAGQIVAKACAKVGMKVGIIDNRGFGGTCSQRGCDPKRILMASVESVAHATQLASKGVAGSTILDWKAAQRFMRSFTEEIPEKTENNLKKLGVHCFIGNASFTAPDTLSFGDKVICADNFVIATGNVPIPLSIEGKEWLEDAEDFLYMEELPKSIVFIGAGYIALEFANMMAIAGVSVTVLEKGVHILDGFDEDLGLAIQKSSEAAGVHFVLNADVKSAVKNDNNITIHYRMEGKMHQRSGERVFNTAGRKPALDLLNVDLAEIAHDKKGVLVNDFLQSETNPRVYACGDVCAQGLPLTPLSGIEGALVAFNLTNPRRKKLDLPKVTPTVVFTQPQTGAVGMTESEARSNGFSLDIKTMDAHDWFMPKHINSSIFWFKIIIDTVTDQILGAHIHGPNAGETINIFALAIDQNITATDLGHNMIFTYPSWAGDVRSMLS